MSKIHLTVILAIISLLHGWASAQTVAATSAAMSQNLFVDVVDKGNNVSTTTNWETSWGAYSKDQGRVRALELTMRNPARLLGEYQVEWYFFALPLKGGKRFIYDKGSKKISLPPNGMQKATILSTELASHKASYDYYYYSDVKTGARPEGWAILVKIGDKVIQRKASNAQIEQIVNDPDTFDALVNAKPRTN